MTQTGIAVVGAGIGGLTAALALARTGRDVVVYEQSAALGEIGAGLHVSPNGMHVMRALGLEDALLAVAVRPQAIATRHFETGEPNFEGPIDDAFLARFGAPFLSLHRADLHDALAAACAASSHVELRLGHRLERVTETTEGVTLGFESGQSARAACVVGADGVHSAVRAHRHGEVPTRFTGHVAYRGMVAVTALEPGLIESKLNVWVGPDKHFVAYPVRRGELVNYVAIVEEAGWQDESWTTRADPERLAEAFAGWDRAVCALIGTTQLRECYKWALLGREPLSSWSTARTTLLGDAAHPMVPYLAQGAVMAIEDAWVLAACLRGAAPGEAGERLRRYESARLDRTAAMQRAAWEQGQKNHAVGREAGGDTFRGGAFSDPGWIYGVDVTREFPM